MIAGRRRTYVKDRIRILLSAVLLIAALLMLLTGCGGSAEEAAQNFEIEGYMTHTIPGDKHWEFWGSEGIPEELYSFSYIQAAAVVTNNSGDMYKYVVLSPVAYDADGNRMEDVFTEIQFEDESMDSYKEVEPSNVVSDVGAGERSFSTNTYKLADGAEEPDHIEWEVTKAIKVNGENTSFGLEASSSEDSGGVHFTVTNNSDTDYDLIDTAVIFIDDDGYIAEDGVWEMNYLNEDETEPETLKAHESYDEYVGFDEWGLPRGCRYEVIPMVHVDQG